LYLVAGLAALCLILSGGAAESATPGRTPEARQLPYAELTSGEMGIPEGSPQIQTSYLPDRNVPGRRIPEVVPFSNLAAPDLPSRALPLPKANTLASWNYAQHRFGRIQNADGSMRFFSPQTALVKFRAAARVSAVRLEEMHELESIEAIRSRPDVAFAELDYLQYRQFIPNDTVLSNQWHHATIDSFAAWEKSLGNFTIRIGIVDSPFQMDHPDLAANVVAGWSVVSNAAISASAGIPHSTTGAGMAAAVVNNNLGVAGAANCAILPVHIAGFTSEMYEAVIWAADHDVRVVNISWTGADSPSLNDAGLYLHDRARGLLAMAGVNGTGFLNYPNHPYIYCVSMTDAADNMRSRNGDHIDFSAPGFGIYSTTTDSGYGGASGTSFSTPLFCGIAASLLSINPTLSPDEVVEILKSTADDLGEPGWDRFYGWGRIHFGRAATVAQSTLPNILQIARSGSQATVIANYRSGLDYSLWKTPQIAPANWFQVTNTLMSINANLVTLTDPDALSPESFYKVRAVLP